MDSIEAIKILDSFLEKNPDYEEAFILRGKIHWNMNQRRFAINDYLEAIRINPESKARILLEYANNILDFYNKDLLNP